MKFDLKGKQGASMDIQKFLSENLCMASRHTLSLS